MSKMVPGGQEVVAVVPKLWLAGLVLWMGCPSNSSAQGGAFFQFPEGGGTF